MIDSDHYWLTNVQVPISVLANPDPVILAQANREHLASVHLEIQAGVITQVCSTQLGLPESGLQIEGKGGQVWPCFVDLHTHLDKGHVWPRSPNPDGTFEQALEASRTDIQQIQNPEDFYRRMDFGLKCSYAHGTQAIRTHLVCSTATPLEIFDIFQSLQQAWSGRLSLQAVALAGLDIYVSPLAEPLADRVAELGGLLGGVVRPQPDLLAQLDRVFTLAQERGLDLDFHTDETSDPSSMTLRAVAEAALRHQFQGQIVCGHCCNLAVQAPDVVQATLDRVKAAGIGIVSLPMCNLYLQDRLSARTPRWRGVTVLKEIKQMGIPVAMASDNCRDPFFGFGDHDGLEVFTQSVRIAHLDTPYGNWPQAITTTPADLMRLPTLGRIGVGMAADLIWFKGRGFSELLSRPQHDRMVFRQGRTIQAPLPDYAELDDLMSG